MTFTRLAVAGGVAATGALCWLAAIGFTAATEVMVTLAALVVLVAGGSWLSGRAGVPAPRGGRPRPPAHPPEQPEQPEAGTGGP